MYCTACGADNSLTASFCRQCGAAIEEEVTRVALRRDETVGESVETAEGSLLPVETKIFFITPTLMFVKLGYVLAAIGALLLVALVVGVFPSIPTWTAILFGMLLLAIPSGYHLRQKLIRYTLSETNLEIDQGLIARSTRSVPLRRIQDVTVSATAAQRILGIGDLLIDNASDEGGKIVLRNINAPRKYADELLKQMRRLER
jgi:uncharacterized membrane protein YdbT with pleckstrin-like domain